VHEEPTWVGYGVDISCSPHMQAKIKSTWEVCLHVDYSRGQTAAGEVREGKIVEGGLDDIETSLMS
jgi:hypothetical protein